jgi:hypothetical protein
MVLERNERRGGFALLCGGAGYSALVILLALFLPQRYTRGSDFGLVLGFYALAKALELCDTQIFTALHVVSGHTLKHLAAAASGFCILQMLRKRKPVTTISSNFNSGYESAPNA